MTPPPPVLADKSYTPYRDRSGGLTGFGVLLIILGLLCGFFALLAGAVTMANRADDFKINFLAVLIYGGLAIILMWLGFGSIQAQRWARSLIMLSSWSISYIGVFMSIFIVFAFPSISSANNEHAVPPAAQAVGLVFAFSLVVVLFVILPGLMGWFYSHRDVKITCEDRHPEPSWTDACPPTVLFLSLWQAFGMSALLFSLLNNHLALPFFGKVLSGGPGALVCLLQAGLMGSSAWLLYRLQPAGWWLGVGQQALVIASSVLNRLYLDYNELYRAMGYDGATLEKLQQNNFVKGGFGFAILLLGVVPMVVLLIYCRRYFLKTRTAPPGESNPPPTYL